MLLAIDIGNTVTTLGVFEDTELRATWHLATNIGRMADEHAALLLNLLGHQGLVDPGFMERLDGLGQGGAGPGQKEGCGKGAR